MPARFHLIQRSVPSSIAALPTCPLYNHVQGIRQILQSSRSITSHSSSFALPLIGNSSHGCPLQRHSPRLLSATLLPRASSTSSTSQASEPTPLDIERYNSLSNEYIDTLVGQLEEIEEEREDVAVEYVAGVMTLTYPPHGTYVVNKQPPNRQIWLSSPLTGPKRFDWVQRGTMDGAWVYLRDGTTLAGLLEKELGVKG